jgi:SAM-dependent methyltransferase
MSKFNKKIINLYNHIFPENIFFSKLKLFFFWEFGFIRFYFLFFIFGIKKYTKINENTKGVDYSRNQFFQEGSPRYKPDFRIFHSFFLLNSIPELNKESILILGPRYEAEIFLARAFKFKIIKALDTFSYSPLIEIGDIHRMPYEDSKFQNIVCGYTFSYSTAPSVFAKEMCRVLKKNGILIIAVQRVDADNSTDNFLKGKDRIQSKQAFNNFFPNLENFCYIESKNHVLIGYQK